MKKLIARIMQNKQKPFSYPVMSMLVLVAAIITYASIIISAK